MPVISGNNLGEHLCPLWSVIAAWDFGPATVRPSWPEGPAIT